MKELADQIELAVHENTEFIRQMPESMFEAKPRPEKWSKKEILGHLVDSAQNNLQRLIRTQYEEVPKIVYQQDTWVRLADYQSYKRADLLDLWIVLNKHYAHLLRVMPQDVLGRLSDVGQKEPQVHTLEFIAEDYLKHMLHHLNQIKS